MDEEHPREFKRVVTISDLHCGHEFGLTPPAWQYQEDGHPRIAKAAKFQKALWGFATEAIDSLKPIDILIVNGDAIDGKGDKSGGVEQITTDRLEQCEMAAEFINYAEAKQVRLLYGTRYHVGKDEDFEQVLVDKVRGDVSIQGHFFGRVYDTTLDVKHKVGSSGIPHGRHTALAKARLWNVIWNSEHERQPKADIIQRAHVHYVAFAGGAHWLGMTNPPLSYGTSYGIRECEGMVDVGITKVDIYPGGRYAWNYVLAQFPEMKALVEYL
jgi:hypothetical protein